MLGDAEADGLDDGVGLTEADTDTLGEREILKLGVTLGLNDGDALGVIETLTLADDDGDNEIDKLGDRDTDTLGDKLGLIDGDKEGEEEPPVGINCQAAVVLSPVFTYTFRPVASKSRKMAPLRKPAYPSGTVFPSASKIKSVALDRVLLKEVA